MVEKRTILICLGSSCFSRGNNTILTQIKRFIRLHNLEEKVTCKGDHCLHECTDGPNMRIDGRLIHQVSTESIDEILTTELRDLMNYAD